LCAWIGHLPEYHKEKPAQICSFLIYVWMSTAYLAKLPCTCKKKHSKNVSMNSALSTMFSFHCNCCRLLLTWKKTKGLFTLPFFECIFLYVHGSFAYTQLAFRHKFKSCKFVQVFPYDVQVNGQFTKTCKQNYFCFSLQTWAWEKKPLKNGQCEQNFKIVVFAWQWGDSEEDDLLCHEDHFGLHFDRPLFCWSNYFFLSFRSLFDRHYCIYFPIPEFFFFRLVFHTLAK